MESFTSINSQHEVPADNQMTSMVIKAQKQLNSVLESLFQLQFELTRLPCIKSIHVRRNLFNFAKDVTYSALKTKVESFLATINPDLLQVQAQDVQRSYILEENKLDFSASAFEPLDLLSTQLDRQKLDEAEELLSYSSAFDSQIEFQLHRFQILLQDEQHRFQQFDHHLPPEVREDLLNKVSTSRTIGIGRARDNINQLSNLFFQFMNLSNQDNILSSQLESLNISTISRANQEEIKDQKRDEDGNIVEEVKVQEWITLNFKPSVTNIVTTKSYKWKVIQNRIIKEFTRFYIANDNRNIDVLNESKIIIASIDIHQQHMTYCTEFTNDILLCSSWRDSKLHKYSIPNYALIQSIEFEIPIFYILKIKENLALLVHNKYELTLFQIDKFMVVSRIEIQTKLYYALKCEQELSKILIGSEDGVWTIEVKNNNQIIKRNQQYFKQNQIWHLLHLRDNEYAATFEDVNNKLIGLIDTQSQNTTIIQNPIQEDRTYRTAKVSGIKDLLLIQTHKHLFLFNFNSKTLTHLITHGYSIYTSYYCYYLQCNYDSANRSFRVDMALLDANIKKVNLSELIVSLDQTF